jgi:hypothetical protein
MNAFISKRLSKGSPNTERIQFETFKFQMRCRCSREMRREWRTLRVVWDPVLSHWANLCRAYGAEFILALSYSLCRHLSGDM